MKLSIVILMLFLTGCAGFTVNGIAYSDFQKMDKLHLAAGMASSMIIHELGHYAIAKHYGAHPQHRVVQVDYYADHLSRSKQAWIARGGFVSQSIIGVFLTVIPQTRGSDFVLGFTGYSLVEHGTYTILHETGGRMDTANLDAVGRNGRMEALGFATLSGGLFYLNLSGAGQ